METKLDEFITVYKCMGYAGNYLSRTWINEVKDNLKGDELTAAQTIRNNEILDSKEEPYYTDLMTIGGMIGVKDPYKLRDILKELLEASKTRSFRREDIDALSAEHQINLQKLLYWRQRIVRLA